MARLPLNGVKTHPLSEHAKGVLRWVASAEKERVAAYLVNPGVRDRLTRDDPPLAEVVRKGDRNWLVLTEAGREFLKSLGSEPKGES